MASWIGRYINGLLLLHAMFRLFTVTEFRFKRLTDPPQVAAATLFQCPVIMLLLINQIGWVCLSVFADEALRKLGQEVLELMKMTAGVDTFTAQYALVLKTLVDKRQMRKRERAAEVCVGQ